MCTSSPEIVLNCSWISFFLSFFLHYCVISRSPWQWRSSERKLDSVWISLHCYLFPFIYTIIESWYLYFSYATAPSVFSSPLRVRMNFSQIHSCKNNCFLKLCAGDFCDLSYSYQDQDLLFLAFLNSLHIQFIRFLLLCDFYFYISHLECSPLLNV